MQLAEIFEGMRVIDLCCGSGDMAFAAVNAVGKKGYVCGCDTVQAMLKQAEKKWEMLYRKYSYPKELAEFRQGDCESLDRPDRLFDAVTCAFGIRNSTDLSRFIESATRQLRPGGKIAILEFSLPAKPVFRFLVSAYLIGVVPILGWMITGKLREYWYLSRSIRRFSREVRLTRLLLDSGFTDVCSVPVSGGIVTVYLGRKNP